MQRNTIYNYLLFLLLLFYTNACTEDTIEPSSFGILNGVVLNSLTNTPIDDAAISTIPATSEVFTNSSGQFVMKNIPTGEYTLIVKSAGYDNENTKIRIINSIDNEVVVKLSATNRLAPLPDNPSPSNNSNDQALTINLQWEILDAIAEEVLSFDIIVYNDNSNTPFKEIIDHPDTSAVIDGLEYNTNYFWQVNVISSTGNITKGDIWTFETLPFPDNRYLFASKREGNYEIYSSDAAGETLTKITGTSNFELKPLYSTKRDLIAYSSNTQIDFHIYMMAADGSNPQKVTTLPISGFHNQGVGFCWSPDNGRFLYSHYEKLYKINRNGTGLVLVAIAPHERNFRVCDWTAVNNKIVVETIGSAIYSSEIYLMNSDGSDTVRLVDDLPGIIQDPSFSIDAKEVIFTRDQSGFESSTGRQLDAHIFSVNIETKEIIDLSNGKIDGTNDLQPRFSPDGAKIIFVNVSNDGSGVKSVWTMDKDGGNRRMLFENAEMPDWQ